MALRAERLGVSSPSLWLVAETSLPHVLAHIDALAPDVVVVDSIQTVHDPELASAPGSVGQVRECAHRLVGEAKARGVSVVLVGHVTKDGGLAGPRVLEHLVDTVLSFEGERHHALRLLRAVKHRFGSTHELGLFEMGERRPGRRARPERAVPGRPAAGRARVGGGAGARRPAAAAGRGAGAGGAQHRRRRPGARPRASTAAGWRSCWRCSTGTPSSTLSRAEVHVAVAGGVRVPEPGADLAMALAVASSATERPLPADLVACGEVGLGGELRQVHRTERRLAEAARLGFTRAVVPRSAPDAPDGHAAGRAASIADAIHHQAFQPCAA